MRDARLDELKFDGADTAIVHVRRRNAVGAGFGVGDGDVGDAVDAEGVVESTIVAEDAAVPVGGVFTEADVGDDEEGGIVGAKEADRGDDRAAGVISGGAKGVFGAGGNGHTEKDDRAEAFLDERVEVGY